MEMKKTTIAVVILHYNDFEMTRKYIENLKNLKWDDITHQFVIVDNNSPDGSGSELYEYFKEDVNTSVILLPENIGFARGNNKGIVFAKDELGADMIVVSNNDIDIKTKDFPRLLIREYAASDFAVYGPDIYSLSKKMHQNPMRKSPMNFDDVNNKIKKIDRILPMLYILNNMRIYDQLKNLKDKIKKNKENSGFESTKRIEGCVLHGAFFVLSREYLKMYPEGLFEKTFLYMEEDILAYRCNLKRLKMVYDPLVQVIHYDGVSSMKMAGNRCMKFICEMKETRKSCEAYIEYMKNNK